MEKKIALSEKDKDELESLARMLQNAFKKAELGDITPQTYQTMVRSVGLTSMDIFLYLKMGHIPLRNLTEPNSEQLTLQTHVRIYSSAYMDGYRDGLREKIMSAPSKLGKKLGPLA